MDFANPRITIDNDFYFARELAYLDKFKDYSWAPELIKIDKDNKRIFFKWYGNTCNDMLFHEQTVDNQQLQDCVKDLLDAGVYKLNIYPHCFYFDSNNKIHTMAFYACIDTDYPYLPLEQVKDMIGLRSIDRWNEAIEGDFVNFEKFFKRALVEHVKWPGDPLKELVDV
jgi:hypothetical protein